MSAHRQHNPGTYEQGKFNSVGLPPPTRTIFLNGESIEAKRYEILNYFMKTFDLYESLFNCLADERAWFTKSIPLRHPLIFYYGHTAVFFINKLIAAGSISERVNPHIESLLAIGVDEMSWDDLNEKNYAWPSIAEMRAYRAEVREKVTNYIKVMPINLPIDWESPAWLILMGIEHEHIHLETSSVLIRQLPIEWVRPQPNWPACAEGRDDPATVPTNTLIPVKGGEIHLGKNDQTYGWDNEYGDNRVHIAPFEASRMLVSNAEFLEFIVAGGYSDERWWTEEGKAWHRFSKTAMPIFWVGSLENHSQLKLRLMAEEVPMRWDWPVEVNELEAAAFCNWKANVMGRPVQLPCEAEWVCLRSQVPGDQPTWLQAPGNINLEYWASSCPVDRFAHGNFFDIIGNVWEWTSTAFDAFNGFKVHPLYDDFSTPTFDGKHNLIKGGSWISMGNEALVSARYAFRRHFFQHAGFRYVVSTYKEPSAVNHYETDQKIAQYMDFHYGPTYFDVPNFSKTLAKIAIELCPLGGRAFDIGCSVGRASFELARHFSEVEAIDYSARFIEIALQLAKHDVAHYSMPLEGELVNYLEARLTSHDIGPKEIARVQFTQADALNLKPKYGNYDLILAANLLDHLREPARFLREIKSRMKPGAILMLTCPYTWRTEFTPKENWLGGVRENGEALTSYQSMQRILSADFDEVMQPREVPFIIRETARKYEHVVSQLTVWRLRFKEESRSIH